MAVENSSTSITRVLDIEKWTAIYDGILECQCALLSIRNIAPDCHTDCMQDEPYPHGVNMECVIWGLAERGLRGTEEALRAIADMGLEVPLAEQTASKF